MAHGDKFAGYARSNRRKDKRRAVACRLAAAGRTLGVTKDLSMGGLAISGTIPGIGRGSMLPMQMQLPGGAWIELPARVVRNGNSRDNVAGDFAVQFNELSPQAFAALERIMVAPLRAHG